MGASNPLIWVIGYDSRNSAAIPEVSVWTIIILWQASGPAIRRWERLGQAIIRVGIRSSHLVLDIIASGEKITEVVICVRRNIRMIMMLSL